MAGATPQIIPKDSQDAVVAFLRNSMDMMLSKWNIRAQLENIDRAYMRENDFSSDQSKAKVANRLGDPTKYQNVVVPVVKPQVEAAVVYQASVFLTQFPLFGFLSTPDQMDVAMQFNTIIEDSARRGGWVSEFIKFFRDGYKYNLCALEVCWERKVTWAVETDIGFTGGKQGKPKEVIWEGNCIYRWDLYNSFWDTRYSPSEVHKYGDYAGTTKLVSRVHLKKFLNELPDKMVGNIKPAFESGLGGSFSNSDPSAYYIPNINPDAILDQAETVLETNWLTWAGLLSRPANEIQYKDSYYLTKLYARIIPQDFGLRVPAANTPQIWKFYIVNFNVLVYAERQTNAHDLLPVLFGQPNDDGLGYQTKSLASDAQPFQEVASALINSEMQARRRAISDRTLFDPSRVSAAHINSDNPSAKIPVRPAAYGKPVSEAVYPFPFRNDQAGQSFSDLQLVLGLADKLNGQNPIRQGQFVKGNKNNPEFQAVMAGATGSDQLRALVMEDQVMTPLKEILKINILQYQSSGEIYSTSYQKNVPIDPLALRKAALAFKTTDGLTDASKQINGDEFNVALQVMGSSPQIGAGYNISPAFSYMMKTRNVDLKPFEKSQQQMAYEQALNAWTMAAQESAKKGVPFNQPQPVPAQYGYIPGAPNNQQGTPPANQTPAAQPQSMSTQNANAPA